MAAGGGDDHISIDDSDRENFRRRGRSPASKQGGPVERGRERRERERGDHEIARSLEQADNGRSERSLGSNRGGNGREKERSEQEFARSSGRSRDLRRERSPGSTGGSHERDDSNKPARGAEREDNGRRRDRSPFRRGFTTRDRERGSERRESWRRDRSPVSRRGGSRERERGERRYGRGFDRANNGRREISPGSKRGASRDRFGRGQDDVARGGLGRGDHVRRDVRSLTRVADNRGNDNSERGGFDRRDRGRRGRSSESNDGIETGGRERNSDVDSRKGIARKSLSATEDGEGTPPVRDLENTIVQEDGRATDDEAKRHDLEYLRETSDSGSGELKNGDDGSNRRDSEENAERKQQILSKIATEDTRNAVSDEDVDEGVNREGRTKDTPKPDDEGSGDSYADSEEDEDGDDEKEKKRKSRRREKRRRHHGENEEGRIKGSRKLDVDKDHSASGSEEDKENDEVRARRKNPKRREKHRRHGGKHSEHSRGKKRKHRRRGTSSDEASESDSASTSSEVSESEDSAQREKAKKHRKKRRRKEKEREVEREMKRKMKKKMRELKEKRLKAELKKKKKEIRSKRPITSSWGKYGILKDIDMWNKKPEFSAWLAEVKKVNVETLANWEEKQMFKEFMEDYNTATFPSKKYYNLDIYHRRKVTKEKMKGMAKALVNVERTDFNDEDDRRLELQREREVRKEAEVEALMRKMQSGMAQDMREQAQLREEMQYQYRLGNTEAAQAIQRRLDPDAEKFTK